MRFYKKLVQDNAHLILEFAAEGKPRKDGTKIWITKSGKKLLANNNAGNP